VSPPESTPEVEAVAALILDLDGVVTDTAVQHAASWHRLLADLDLPFDEVAYERTRGRSRTDSLELLLAGAIGAGGDPTVVASLDRHALLERKNDLYRAAVAGLAASDVLPGARELVVAARDRGLRTAIGSSSRNAREVVAQLGLAPLFDVIADGHAGAPKPAPDIFLAAAAALGLAPAVCVVIEDAAAGVDAARAAGMRCVGVGPADRVGHADLLVATTAELDLDGVLQVTHSAGGPVA
jgi:beta-phosphoglucomutase